MKDWRKLYARQTVGSRRMLEDAAIEAGRWIVDDLVRSVLEQIDLDHAAQIGPVEVAVVDHLLERNLVGWMAEVLALELVTPNPFPRVRLFRWLPA